MSLINNNYSGTIAIEGNALVGSTLKATINDGNKFSENSVVYQWYSNNNPIKNATKNTYTPDTSVIGTAISVKAIYKDYSNNIERVASNSTEAVIDSAIVNVSNNSNSSNVSTEITSNVVKNTQGSVTIEGQALVGETLRAIVKDADGISADNISYQWYAGLSPLRNATKSTYTPDSGVTKSSISVKVTYKDDAGFTQQIKSAGTADVAYAQQANTQGSVTIEGQALVGETLKAIVKDADGVSADNISYQWYAGLSPLRNATKSTYTPDSGVTKSSISVKITYKDDNGGIEKLTSKPTETVSVVEPVINESSAPIVLPLQLNTIDEAVYIPKPTTSLVVNVKSRLFGAKGNGSADDTLAIENAIKYVSKRGGGTVEIPEGTYLIDTVKNISMQSNVTVKMTDDTILKAKPNAEEVYNIFQFTNVKNAHIYGGTLVGDRFEHLNGTGEWGSGIRIYSSKNVVIENVTTKDFWGDGFYIGSLDKYQRTEDVVLYKVTADNNRRQGVTIVDGDEIKVINSTFKNINGTNPSAGLCVEPDSDNKVRGLEVINSKFIDNEGTGIALYKRTNVDNVELSNFVIKNNESVGNMAGIVVNGVTDSVITDNFIDATGRPEYRWPGIKLDEYAVDNVVSNNTIINAGMNSIDIRNLNQLDNDVSDNMIFGDKSDDVVRSTLGSDILIGQEGINKLYGNEGEDVFVINTNIDGRNMALIRDFDTNENDKIGLSEVAFGELEGRWFAENGQSKTTETRVYQKGEALYYDEDGSRSSHSGVKFATLNSLSDKTPQLTEEDFTINFIL